MARVKIKFPEQKPLFTATIPVRIGDINYGGHVGNDAVLSVVHEARMQMLAAYGYSEMNAAGNAMIMADVMIAYKGESFYGDTLSVDVFAEELTGISFDLLYRITTQRDGAPCEVAHCKTGMVCFDYAARKKTAMTPAMSTFLTGDVTT